MTTKAERAITALRECADAVEDLPKGLMSSFLGIPILQAEVLRNEADSIEAQRELVRLSEEKSTPVKSMDDEG